MLSRKTQQEKKLVGITFVLNSIFWKTSAINSTCRETLG